MADEINVTFSKLPSTSVATTLGRGPARVVATTLGRGPARVSGLSRQKTEATPEVTEEVTKKEDGNLELFFFFERMSTPTSRKQKFSMLTYSPTSVAPKCAANSHYSDIMPSCSLSCANPIPSEENPTSAKVAASLQQSSTNDVESGHPIPIPL